MSSLHKRLGRQASTTTPPTTSTALRAQIISPYLISLALEHPQHTSSTTSTVICFHDNTRILFFNWADSTITRATLRTNPGKAHLYISLRHPLLHGGTVTSPIHYYVTFPRALLQSTGIRTTHVGAWGMATPRVTPNGWFMPLASDHAILHTVIHDQNTTRPSTVLGVIR